MMKKLIVLATVVTALGVGTATGLTLSSAANPKLVVSCEGNSCSVQLPGALLDEMNRTMTKSVSEPAESQTADERTFLKGLGQLFGQQPTQGDATVEDPDADLLREVEKIFK
jgi:hypothetical protein